MLELASTAGAGGGVIGTAGFAAMAAQRLPGEALAEACGAVVAGATAAAGVTVAIGRAAIGGAFIAALGPVMIAALGVNSLMSPILMVES